MLLRPRQRCGLASLHCAPDVAEGSQDKERFQKAEAFALTVILLKADISQLLLAVRVRRQATTVPKNVI